MGRLRVKLVVFIVGVLCSVASQAESLSQTVAYTLEHNPQALLKLTERLKTEQQLRQTKAGFLPTVDLNMTYGQENSRTDTTVKSSETLERSSGTLQFVQNVFKGFETKNLVSADKKRVLSAQYQFDDSAENVAVLAIRAYIEVLRQQDLVQISRNNVIAHAQTLDLIQQRVAKGLSRDSELRQSEGRLALAEANLDAEIRNAQDAEAVFLEVVGKMPTNLMAVPHVNDAYLSSQRHAIDMAIMNHPVMKSARTNVEVARFQHKATQATNFPSVDVVASAGYDNSAEVKINSDTEESFFGVAMNYNLFSGGSDLARQREAALQRQTQLEELDRVKRETEKLVRTSWHGYETAHVRLPKLQSHKVNSELTLKSYRQQYVLGKRTLIDVLNSENEYFSSSRAYLSGQYDVLIAEYTLLKNMGVLTDYFDAELPGKSANRFLGMPAQISDKSVNLVTSQLVPTQRSQPTKLPVTEGESLTQPSETVSDDAVFLTPAAQNITRPVSVPMDDDVVSSQSDVRTYLSKQNDTLWSIAKRFQPGLTPSVYQLMMAIFVRNPKAFLDNNMHKLATGKLLIVPSKNIVMKYDIPASRACFLSSQSDVGCEIN